MFITFPVWDKWPATRICGSGRCSATADSYRYLGWATECHGRWSRDHRTECDQFCGKVPGWNAPNIWHNCKQHSDGSRSHEYDLNKQSEGVWELRDVWDTFHGFEMYVHTSTSAETMVINKDEVLSNHRITKTSHKRKISIQFVIFPTKQI